MGVVDKETAAAEYERWCESWKIGRKAKYAKGEDLEQIDQQKEIIIDLICEGNFVFEENEIIYTLIDPIENYENVKIKRPKGSIIMSGDRFKENQSGHRAISMVAEATGLPDKVVSKFEYNTDISSLMAVLGHFLTA